MIPIIEVQGYIAIIITTIILISRLYYCFTLYDNNFIIDMLSLALLTSITWMSYCGYRSYTAMMYQFIPSVIIYITAILYITHTQK
jgi:hypothetical protein